MSSLWKRALWPLVIILSLAGCRRAASSDTLSVTIVHLNDLGGRVRPGKGDSGGLARIAGELDDLRRENPELLFLVSGDLITGSPLSSLTRGEALFRLVNLLDISAFVPGNHEFDYGLSQYRAFMKIADFPFIAANMRLESGKIFADAPYVILSAGEAKVGVIGVITQETPWLTFPENTRGVTFDDPVRVMNRLVPQVDRDAHLVVALTHLGIDGDRKLARRVNPAFGGIDLIIGGHSHDVIKRPKRVRKTWIAQAGEDGRYIGIIRIHVERSTEKIVSLKGKLIRIGAGRRKNDSVAAAVDAEEAALPIDLDRAIGRASRRLDRDDDLAPWIASVMRRHVRADIGLVNKGGVRDDLDAGPVSYRDIFRVMPFDNRVVLVRIPGKDLRRMLARGPLIPDRPISVDPRKIYRVGTMDFVASMYGIPDRDIDLTDMLVRDLMVEDIEARKVIP